MVLIAVAVVEMTAYGLSSYCSSVVDLETMVADAVADATTDVSNLILWKASALVVEAFHIS